MRSRFFKPKALPKLDTIENGGMQENYPVMIALSEFRVLWPEKGGHPEYVLSLSEQGQRMLRGSRRAPNPKSWQGGSLA